MQFGWRGALGIVLSVALLAWTLKDVSFPEVWQVLRASNGFYFALSSAGATGIFLLRAYRWRPILHDVAPGAAIGPLWRSTAVGMMINNVVPARAGEIARAFALTREVPRVSFAAAFASLVVDRLFDSVVLLLLLSAALVAPGFPDGVELAGRPVWQLAATLGVISTVAGAGVALLAFAPDWIIRVFESTVGRVLPATRAPGARLLRSFASGMGVLRSPRRFAEVFAWTLAHWLMNALAFWFGFLAVGLSLPYSAALFLQGLIAVGVAIPSSPGFFGVFEGFAKLGLGVYGVPADAAVAWAFGFHLLSYIPITVIGAIYFARLGLSLGQLSRQSSAPGGAS